MSHRKPHPLDSFNFATPYNNTVSLMQSLLDRIRIPYNSSDNRSKLNAIIKADTTDTNVLKDRLNGKYPVPQRHRTIIYTYSLDVIIYTVQLTSKPQSSSQPQPQPHTSDDEDQKASHYPRQINTYYIYTALAIPCFNVLLVAVTIASYDRKLGLAKLHAVLADKIEAGRMRRALKMDLVTHYSDKRDADVLRVDEPCRGLFLQRVGEIWAQAVNRAYDGVALLVSSHGTTDAIYVSNGKHILILSILRMIRHEIFTDPTPHWGLKDACHGDLDVHVLLDYEPYPEYAKPPVRSYDRRAAMMALYDRFESRTGGKN
eukprot:248459_1